jgi:putative ABC transport system permease protein
LLKHKLYAFINIVGLAIGIAFFTLLALLISNELSYDDFHSKKDRIYRAIEIVEQKGIGEKSASVPFPLGPTILERHPDFVENYVRLFNFQRINHSLETDKKKYTESNFYFADASFFEVFDFPLKSGVLSEVFSEPNSVVISSKKAIEYFGSQDPIGQFISYEGKFDLEVTGVFEPKKYQSHIDFDFIATMVSVRLDDEISYRKLLNDWIWNPAWTYFVIKEEQSPEDLEFFFVDLVKEKFFKNMKDYTSIYLQPLNEIHLHSDLDYELSPNGDIKYVFIFSAIALLILIIATINFTNLSTARSSTRAKEIGVRKAIGASQGELIMQFLVEFLLISFLAIVIGMTIVEICLPYLSELTLTGFDFTLFGLWKPLAITVSAGLMVGLLSSVYPSYYLSKFRPTQALNGSSTKGVRSKMFRSILVVVQFVITVFLLVSTIVASKQWDFMTSTSLGFGQESVIVLPIANTDISTNYVSFKNSLLKSPSIESVTGMEEIIGLNHQTHRYTIESDSIFFPSVYVRDGFIETMGIKLVAGSDFKTEEIYKGVIVNESMVRFMGWESPESAIGKTVGTLQDGRKKIVGVMRDFNFESLHNEVNPFVITIVRNRIFRMYFTKYMGIKVKRGESEKALADIQKLWNEYLPERGFEYYFMNKLINEQYKAERKLGKVSGYFSVVAILLACLGIFGLSSFTIDQRKREIAIRKSLGSSDEEIVLLLTKEFTVLVGISIGIGWLISYFIMQSWLNSFPFHTEMDIFIFLFTGAIALGITLLTISYHTVRAAKREPVEALT